MASGEWRGGANTVLTSARLSCENGTWTQGIVQDSEHGRV